MVLVGEFEPVHANDAADAVVDEAGVEVSVTTGFTTVGVTVQANVALLEPPELETFTVNVWGPTARLP